MPLNISGRNILDVAVAEILPRVFEQGFISVRCAVLDLRIMLFLPFVGDLGEGFALFLLFGVG